MGSCRPVCLILFDDSDSDSFYHYVDFLNDINYMV